MSVSANAIPRRVGALINSAAKVQGAQWLVVHREQGRELELISRTAVSDDELRDSLAGISLVEETQLRIRDDLSSLQPSSDPVGYVLQITNDDGRELARDRLRIRTEGEPTGLATTGLPPGAAGWEEREMKSPTAQTMQAAITRQQFRHNEQILSLALKSIAPIAQVLQQAQGLNASLSERLEVSYAARARDAEQSIAVARAARTMEAEARSEEMRAEAISTAARTLSEWVPVAVHKIARKYGMSGDADVDPILEKLVTSLKPEQLEGLSKVLTPFQQNVLGDIWCTVNDRIEAKKKAAEAERKKNEPAPAALSPNGSQNGAAS